MTALDKAKKIIRTADDAQEWQSWHSDHFQNGYQRGEQDAKFGHFGRKHRNKGFNHAYCLGYIMGYRAVKPGAWARHYHQRGRLS